MLLLLFFFRICFDGLRNGNKIPSTSSARREDKQSKLNKPATYVIKLIALCKLRFLAIFLSRDPALFSPLGSYSCNLFS